MNGLAWGMFFIGMAIGLLGSVLMCWKTFKDEEKSIKDNYQFIKKWSDLTDEQYKNFDDYYNKRMDSLDKFAKDITDITIKMAENYEEHDAQNTDVLRNLIEINKELSEQIEGLRNEIGKNIDNNDNRWVFMQNHILREEKNHEYENLGAENGTSESGYIRDQAAEQAPVVSGEEDAFLVRDELEEDGLDASTETEEV